MLRIPLHGKHGQGKFALVDDDMSHLFKYRWVLGSNGYVSRSATKNGVRRGIALHNEVMGVVIPDRKNPVDHINRDPLDNRRSNLRIVPKSVDLRNQSLKSTNTTGAKYVYRRGGTRTRPTVRWVVWHQPLKIHKTFNTLAEAQAYSVIVEEKVQSQR